MIHALLRFGTLTVCCIAFLHACTCALQTETLAHIPLSVFQFRPVI